MLRCVGRAGLCVNNVILSCSFSAHECERTFAGNVSVIRKVANWGNPPPLMMSKTAAHRSTHNTVLFVCLHDNMHKFLFIFLFMNNIPASGPEPDGFITLQQIEVRGHLKFVCFRV